jgi:hypothetical protein
MKNWNELNYDEKYEASKVLFIFLKNQRLSNYGYDYRDFRNMSNKARDSAEN